MSLLTVNAGAIISQDKGVLAQLAQNELGLTLQMKIQDKMNEALTKPANYVVDRKTELTKINTAVGKIFADNFEDYVNTKKLPEKLAREMAMKIAKSELENKEIMLNLEYPDLIGQYALSQVDRQTFTNRGSIDIMNAGASEILHKKKKHNKKKHTKK